MVGRHGPALVRVANQFSLCHDDALDAYQRALEIYLRRFETVDVATEGAWMRVVVKHEAMAIRKARAASVDAQDTDFDASEAQGLREVADAVAGEERVGRSVEALKALKPDEARALLLKAEGLSYDEIGRRFGWSYTKVCGSVPPKLRSSRVASISDGSSGRLSLRRRRRPARSSLRIAARAFVPVS